VENYLILYLYSKYLFDTYRVYNSVHGGRVYNSVHGGHVYALCLYYKCKNLFETSACCPKGTTVLKVHKYLRIYIKISEWP
jgi:hypothetical protein